MDTNGKHGETKIIECEICMKEVPISEAKVFEATDYFLHFCGLDCYEKWKNQGKAPKDSAENTGT